MPPTPDKYFCPKCHQTVYEPLCPTCHISTYRSGVSEPRPDPRIGAVFAKRYRLDSLLGQGGMGAVYKGVELGTGRKVAVKVLLDGLNGSSEYVQRMQREARATSSLTSPNTVRVYDFGVNEYDELYLAMELLEGTTLTDLLKQRGSIPWPNAVFILMGILSSLHEAHEAGIAHRDLKPDNVMIVWQGKGRRPVVKVMDFGIAKPFGDSEVTALTQAGATLGTPLYMAPEQVQSKDIDHRVDLYAAGVLLYEMLAGKVPFDAGSQVQTMMLHLTQPPPPLPEGTDDMPTPPELAALYQSLLKKHPDKRPPSAALVIEQLQAIITAYTS